MKHDEPHYSRLITTQTAKSKMIKYATKLTEQKNCECTIDAANQ